MLLISCLWDVCDVDVDNDCNEWQQMGRIWLEYNLGNSFDWEHCLIEWPVERDVRDRISIEN